MSVASPAPDGDGQVGGQLAGQPQLARVVDPGLDPHRLQGLDGGDVPALLEGPAHAGSAPRTCSRSCAGDQTRRPLSGKEIGASIDDGGGGVAGLLDGRRVHDRLEGRAHLPHGLGGAVELAPLEVVAAHHGPHRARLRVDGDERALHLRLLVQRRPSPPSSPSSSRRQRSGSGPRTARQHLGHVAAGASRRSPRAPRGPGRSPIWTTARLRSELEHDALARRRPPPAAGPIRRGGSGSGKRAVLEHRRVGGDEAARAAVQPRAGPRAAPGWPPLQAGSRVVWT